MNIFQTQKRANNDAHIKALLTDNEDVLRIASIHPGIYWKGFALFFLSLYLLIVVTNLGLFLLLVSIITLVFEYFTQYYLLLVLTNRRVLIRHGILHLDTTQLHHSRIESIEIERSLMARILGYSAVIISGTGTRMMVVPYIADGEQFRKDLDNILLKREEAKDKNL